MHCHSLWLCKFFIPMAATATKTAQTLMCKVKLKKLTPAAATSGSEAMRTLGGSPMAVAEPPMLENNTVAIKTRRG